MMMELGLSLGASSKALTLMEKKPSPSSELQANNDLNTTLSIGPIFSTSNNKTSEEEEGDQDQDQEDEDEESKRQKDNILSCVNSLSSSSSHLHDLLPHHSSKPLPLSSFSWHPPSDHNCDEARGSNLVRGLKVKTMPADEEEYSEERTVLSSSPMSGASSFRQVDLSIYSNNNNYGSSNNRKRKVTMMMNESQGDEGNYNYYDHHQRGGCSSRASDEDDNMDVHGGGTRKKLRLSKEQSAFLEESFKEHATLNPKQKLALSKQLNLRPRQVEVWFQNRRARTKLKQTEVDCEYLKRCCETLSEENRRLQKELQELRALKASNSNPFFMQLPATTLTMCPSCERVAPNNSSSNNNNNNNNNSASASNSPKPIATFPFSKPKFYPFPHSKPHQS